MEAARISRVRLPPRPNRLAKCATQHLDLVNFVGKRQAFVFDPNYTKKCLLDIFKEAKGGTRQPLAIDLTNFDLVSMTDDDNARGDFIRCDEVRFYKQYTLLRYDMNFGAVCTWKKRSGDGKVNIRNASIKVDIVGIVSGSTWLITLLYLPLVMPMHAPRAIETRHMAAAGVNGMQVGAYTGALVGCGFGPSGMALGGLLGGFMGIATALGGSCLERRLQS